MGGFLVAFFSFLTFFSFSLEAREEVILTVPKSGTNYLKQIIEEITGCRVIDPTLANSSYEQFFEDSKTIVIGHCEPLVLNTTPQNQELLLLIRDPRDVALSMIDFIDRHGLFVYPGLQHTISLQQWNSLSKQEKLSLLVEDFYDYRSISLSTLFETAIILASQEKCFVVKYESLSPEHNTQEELTTTIQAIEHFFNTEITSSTAQEMIKKYFRNPESRTFNKGKAFRYLDEDAEIIEFLESKLGKYIDYFNYAR